MKKIKVRVSTELEVEFDETSKEFKDLFENFNKYFAECDYEEFAKLICDNAVRLGVDNLEGIGKIKINGEMQTNYSVSPVVNINHPININGDFTMGVCDVDTEIID